MKRIKPLGRDRRQKKANGVAKRWKRIYFKDSKWFIFNNGNKSAEQIWFALLSLGKTPDPDKVNTIIGNVLWTQKFPSEYCAVCNNLIQYGGVELFDSCSICNVCLEEAGKLCK